MERHEPHVSSLRDAVHARRAAAARRRAGLTVVLLVATLATAIAGAFALVPVWAVAIPSALLLAVLYLGRRAVLANTRADRAAHTVHARSTRPQSRRDASRRHGRPAASVRPTVTGRAVQPSQSHTTMIARVRAPQRPPAPPVEVITDDDTPADTVDANETAAPRATDVVVEVAQDAPAVTVPASTDKEWQPVAVPRPVYVTKASAPRWEPAPLTAELRQLTEDRRAELAGAATARETEAPQVVAPVSEDSLGVDLDAVLARRRVAGE